MISEARPSFLKKRNEKLFIRSHAVLERTRATPMFSKSLFISFLSKRDGLAFYLKVQPT